MPPPQPTSRTRRPERGSWFFLFVVGVDVVVAFCSRCLAAAAAGSRQDRINFTRAEFRACRGAAGPAGSHQS